jgi:DNA-binding IclR family transcriptional regulator
MSASKTGKVPAIDRAFAALELLADSKGGLSVSEIARRLKLPKSSTHLIITTLEDHGYLWKDLSSHKYFVGLKLSHLAQVTLEGLELRERAKGFLKDLATKIGLTVHLAILEGSEAVLIEKIQAPGIVKLDTWVGQRMHLNCTAVGKALLAFLSEEEFERTLHGRRLIKHNHYTISSIPELRDEMKKVKAAGYALDNEEEEVGVRCLGAPIFDHTGRVAAAISVAGTTVQLPWDQTEKVAEIVRDTARKISWTLGYGIKTDRRQT